MCLLGPTGTPFASGLFTLTLRLPTNYPAAPPTATFRTKIFHPNVDERTGDVCVDTLKRDWQPSLTLRDVLITIRCLLVYPNPASALNEAAGKLLLEDYDAFATRATLMTEVHAQVPEELRAEAAEARRRDAAADAKPPGPHDKADVAANASQAPPTPPRRIRRAVSPTAAKAASATSTSFSAAAPTTTTSSTTSITNASITAAGAPVGDVEAASDYASDGEDSDASDSGKENVARPSAAHRRSESVKRAHASFLEEEAAAARAGAESSVPEDSSEGRKSPKLKHSNSPTKNPAQPSPTKNPAAQPSATTTMIGGKRLIVAKKEKSSVGKKLHGNKKTAPRIGLKRF